LDKSKTTPDQPVEMLDLSKLKSKICSFDIRHVVLILDACACHVILKIHWHKIGGKIVFDFR